MVKLAVIADDLTGANDTAVQFAKHQIKSRVRLDFSPQKLLQETADVMVIDTDSRNVDAAEAYSRVKKVCEILCDSGIRNIYKKVDSTLRGNLGAEIAAVSDVFQPEIVVIAPAFPSHNRVTIGGYHLLNNLPIELTEIAHAPKTPVTESRIVNLLTKQRNTPIGSISLHTVMAGTEAIKQAVDECSAQGKKWIVFDAVLDEHLQAIVQSMNSETRVLWVGSAGLAEQLPDFYEWSPKQQNSFLAESGPALVVAGSVSKVTQEQIGTVLKQGELGLVKINVVNLLKSRDEEISHCISQVKNFLAQEQDVLIASAVCDRDVADALLYGQKEGIDGNSVSEQTAVALGKIVAQSIDRPLAGMVLTGGDTAIHICRALEAEAMEVLTEVAVGIPLCRLVGGRCNEMMVVTKAGAFGDPDSFVTAMRAIRPGSRSLQAKAL